MKWILLLIPLMLVLAGCIDTEGTDYNLGYNAGANSKSGEIGELKDEVKDIEKDIKWFKKEFERKSDVTREALGNEADLIHEVGVYNERLEAVEVAIENLDVNINQRITDMNKSINQGYFDLNVSIQDLNQFC